MKLKAVFAGILLSHSAFAVAPADSTLVVNFTPVAVENPDHALPDQLICLTEEWAAVDEDLHAKILALRDLEPLAFTVNNGNNPNLCYDPSRVSEAHRGDFEWVLSLIQLKANSKTVLNLSQTMFVNRDPVLSPTASTDQQHPGSIMLRNQERSLGRKILRATALVQGTQVASLGILLMLPKSVTKWEDQPFKQIVPHLKRAYTKPPVWDKDDWAINYISHPHSGSIYYNMLRSQGGTPMQSFLFSTAQSVFWEYVAEAGAEQPSIQDLLFTSTVGSVLGEATHRMTLRFAKNGFNIGEKALIVILNPSYVMNNWFRVKRRPVVVD